RIIKLTGLKFHSKAELSALYEIAKPISPRSTINPKEKKTFLKFIFSLLVVKVLRLLLCTKYTIKNRMPSKKTNNPKFITSDILFGICFMASYAAVLVSSLCNINHTLLALMRPEEAMTVKITLQGSFLPL